jgi:hypothetical protein
MLERASPEAAAKAHARPKKSAALVIRRVAVDALGVLRAAWTASGAHAAAAARGAWLIRADIVIGLGLGAVLALGAALLFARQDFGIISVFNDVWFGGDAQRVIEVNVDPWHPGHFRTSVHPLWGLFVSLPLIVLSRLGVSEELAAYMLLTVSAATFAGLFYAAARATRLRRSEAAATTLLAGSSASAIFLLSVPETYGLGVSSMLLSLVWLAAPRGAHDQWAAPLQSLLSFSFTVTNWLAGLMAAVLGLGVRRALVISAVVFAAASALIVVQQNVFPSAGKLLGMRFEMQYVQGGPPMPAGERALTLVTQGLVAPEPHLSTPQGQLPLVAFSQPVELAWLPLAALVGWFALIAMGLVAAFKGRIRADLVVLVGVLLVGYLGLHMIYGRSTEIFLYTLHFSPFMALIAGWAFHTYRWVAWALLAATLVLTTVNNVQRHTQAIALMPATAALQPPPAPPTP